MIDDFRPDGSPKPAPKLKPTSPTDTAQEPDTSFQTPEQVQSYTDFGPDAPMPVDNRPARGSGHHWFNLPWPPSRQEYIVVLIGLVILGAGVIGFTSLRKPVTTPTAVATPVHTKTTPKSEPKTTMSTLSGLPVSPEVNQRPVVGVMIENSQTARPQSGLGDAGVVFEAIAEGGITRFLALYQDKQPTNIGPVRSARPYYVQWSEGFRAAYVHVGGSPDALADIKAWNVQDINQFYNSGPFHRVSSRPAPHNMYSSVVDLANLAIQKGYKSSFSGFSRKVASPAKQPSASSVTVNISSAIYNSQYVYDAASNSYLRSEGGAAQIDANTGKQLSPSVVIAMVVPLSAGSKTAQGGAYSNYNPIGSGKAYIFQDGTATVGSWNKASTSAQISFANSDGTALKLNPGQVWLTAVDAASKVQYR